MMKAKDTSREFYFITAFPEEVTSWLLHSITLKSIYRAPIKFKVWNIRKNWADRIDHPPYGGGPGMVLQLPPIYRILEEEKLLSNSHIILLCPRGKVLNQSISRDLAEVSQYKKIVFICGHYEGVDERIKHFCSESISIGEYIISSGSLAASVLLESIVRLLPNVISEESLKSESFNPKEKNSTPQFDHAVYAPPRKFLDFEVPEILFSGDHSKIKKYSETASRD